MGRSAKKVGAPGADARFSYLIALQCRLKLIGVDCQHLAKVRMTGIWLQTKQGQHASIGGERDALQKLLIRFHFIEARRQLFVKTA
jgi:hypothetical protein